MSDVRGVRCEEIEMGPSQSEFSKINKKIKNTNQLEISQLTFFSFFHLFNISERKKGFHSFESHIQVKSRKKTVMEKLSTNLD